MNRQRSISLSTSVFSWQPYTTLGCAAYARMSIILWYRSAADGSNSMPIETKVSTDTFV